MADVSHVFANSQVDMAHAQIVIMSQCKAQRPVPMVYHMIHLILSKLGNLTSNLEWGCISDMFTFQMQK